MEARSWWTTLRQRVSGAWHGALRAQLDALLQDVGGLDTQSRACFKKAVPKKKRTLKLPQLRKFLTEVSLALGLDEGQVFVGDMEHWFDAFDFDGNGEIDEQEAVRMVHRVLQHVRVERFGALQRVHVTYKTGTLEDYGFKLKEMLGKGGQGEAWLCEDKKGKKWCLKRYLMRDVDIEEVQREFALMRQFDSPHLAKTHHIFQMDAQLCLINDLHRGGDLLKLLDRSEAQKVERTGRWWAGVFRQILQGLMLLHQNCVIHCDVKESNIMITNEDFKHPQVVVIDFGLASAFAAAGHPFGTPLYLPPEVMKGKHWVPQGDIWSLGVVLLQLMGLNKPGQDDYNFLMWPDLEKKVLKNKINFKPLKDGDARDLAQGMLRRAHSRRVAKGQQQPRFTVYDCLEHPWFGGPTGGAPKNKRARDSQY